MTSQIKSIVSTLFFLTLISAFLFQSCSSDKPTLLKKKNFISVYAELMIIEELAIDEPEKVKLVAQVLSNYKTTQAQFLATKEYYKQDPKFWSRIYKDVEEKIRESDKKQVLVNEQKK